MVVNKFKNLNIFSYGYFVNDAYQGLCLSSTWKKIYLLDEKLGAFVLDVSFCGGEKRTNGVHSYTAPGLGNQAISFQGTCCYTY